MTSDCGTLATRLIFPPEILAVGIHDLPAEAGTLVEAESLVL